MTIKSSEVPSCIVLGASSRAERALVREGARGGGGMRCVLHPSMWGQVWGGELYVDFTHHT